MNKSISHISLLKTLVVAVFVSTSLGVYAQDPNWMVNENDFEHTMTFVSFLNIDGERLASENDKVGVFVDDVCRGVASLSYVQSEDKYYAYLTAFSNMNGENLSFRIYDSTSDVVRNVSGTLNFKINGHRGDLFQAFSFANPTLSATAEIESFVFQDVLENNVTIDNRMVTVELDDAIDVTQLTPVYELSNGATLHMNTIKQTSGEDVLDFSSVVDYQVRSADQSVLNSYTVTVNSVVRKDVTYMKKDAVCYAKGAIKVITTTNDDAQVQLTDNQGNTIAIQNLMNNETIFTDLNPGIYRVVIFGENKSITLIQQD